MKEVARRGGELDDDVIRGELVTVALRMDGGEVLGVIKE